MRRSATTNSRYANLKKGVTNIQKYYSTAGPRIRKFKMFVRGRTTRMNTTSDIGKSITCVKLGDQSSKGSYAKDLPAYQCGAEKKSSSKLSDSFF